MNYNADLGPLQLPAETRPQPTCKKQRSPSYFQRQYRRKRAHPLNGNPNYENKAAEETESKESECLIHHEESNVELNGSFPSYAAIATTSITNQTVSTLLLNFVMFRPFRSLCQMSILLVKSLLVARSLIFLLLMM